MPAFDRLSAALKRAFERPPSIEARALAQTWSGAWLLAVCALAGFGIVDRWGPPQNLPWKPLSIAHPIGSATRAKVAALADDPRRCLALLEEAGVKASPVPDRTDRDYCVVANAVRLQSGGVPTDPSGLVMRCPVAVAWTIWTRHAVEPAARELLDAELTRVETYGTYACRRIYGRETGPPSRHATAEAIDVAGFRTGDGRRVRVVSDWDRGDEAGLFLRRVRDDACRVFGGTLSPDYNAAHRDHFHLETGGWTVCR